MILTHLLQNASPIPTDISALESSISALESAISALEADIRALDNRSVPWEHALPWFTLAVLVGVAMELWVVMHDFREEMETWAIFHFVGVVRSPSKPSVRKLAVEIASLALIVLGIFGELGIGLEIASINGQLRGKSTELRSKNAELRSDSDQLVARLGQKTAELDHANLELKALIQVRDLTVEQQNQIGGALRQFSGKFVLIETYAYDQEALRLAMLIKGALNSGQVDAEVFSNPSPGIVNLPVGVRVSSNDQMFADRLKKSLSDIGKLALTDPAWKPEMAAGTHVRVMSEKAWQADIFVGTKPFSSQLNLSKHPKKGEELHPFSQTIEIFNK